MIQKGGFLAVRSPKIIGKKEKKKDWEGPFLVGKVFSDRTYLLITKRGEMIIPPTKVHFLEKYYL